MIGTIFSHATRRVEISEPVEMASGGYTAALLIIDVAGNQTNIHLFAETPEELEIREDKQ